VLAVTAYEQDKIYDKNLMYIIDKIIKVNFPMINYIQNYSSSPKSSLAFDEEE
jgi:hypothetical protein